MRFAGSGFVSASMDWSCSRSASRWGIGVLVRASGRMGRGAGTSLYARSRSPATGLGHAQGILLTTGRIGLAMSNA
jgi:hypothetical protein